MSMHYRRTPVEILDISIQIVVFLFALTTDWVTIRINGADLSPPDGRSQWVRYLFYICSLVAIQSAWMRLRGASIVSLPFYALWLGFMLGGWSPGLHNVILGSVLVVLLVVQVARIFSQNRPGPDPVENLHLFKKSESS